MGTCGGFEPVYIFYTFSIYWLILIMNMWFITNSCMLISNLMVMIVWEHENVWWVSNPGTHFIIFLYIDWFWRLIGGFWLNHVRWSRIWWLWVCGNIRARGGFELVIIYSLLFMVLYLIIQRCLLVIRSKLLYYNYKEAPLPHGTASYRTVPHHTARYRSVPHRTAPYRTVLHGTTRYCTVPYYWPILIMNRWFITNSCTLISNLIVISV